MLTLQWSQVDFKAGTVPPHAGESKNHEARTFPPTDELRAALEARAGTPIGSVSEGVCRVRLRPSARAGRAVKAYHLTSAEPLSATSCAPEFPSVSPCS